MLGLTLMIWDLEPVKSRSWRLRESGVENVGEMLKGASFLRHSLPA